MRVANYYGPGDVRVESVSEPDLGPDEVRIEIAACGICGTDLHEYEEGPDLTPEEDTSHPLTGVSLPVPLGHEFSGTVTAVGDEAEGVAVGDEVTANPAMVCGDCRYCAEGRHNLCESVANTGLSAKSGGFAESAVVPADNVVQLPDGVPVEYGALVEPFSVGVHATRRSGMQTGDSVAVFGAGPIGISIVQAATAAGAKEVFVSEPRAKRREIAEEVGARTTLDPTTTEAVDEITDATDGGVDVAFEAVGIEPTFKAAIEATKRGGQITAVGISDDDVGLTPNELVVVERTITGSNGYLSGPLADREFEMVTSFLESGEFDPEPMITARISLEDIVEEGFEKLLDPESEHVKILVEP
ncbi:2,3-butanediol dehydrogenase [Haloarchaeobius sp. HME9146]|uniref:2,3-butanediol dehydrogenase n=1 Tax=Haloarchaeobius sp. HME9146 TaxID=2978732 RepID=UPI0021C0EF25|nr:2,3-butanediol dehydrogenase [Haloarchaeobius sp. HME9146]MCT9098107.1 2,3-butanediol dehydrogenase [Haloarchaeobius sp. HME9146]